MIYFPDDQAPKLVCRPNDNVLPGGENAKSIATSPKFKKAAYKFLKTGTNTEILEKSPLPSENGDSSEEEKRSAEGNDASEEVGGRMSLRNISALEKKTPEYFC